MSIRLTAQRSMSDNSATLVQSAQPVRSFLRSRWRFFSVICFGVTLTWAGQVNAQINAQVPPQTAPRPQAETPAPASTPPADAPPELLQTLRQVDAAANQRNLREVMSYYSANFTNSDGLTYTMMRDSLKTLWQRYPNLSYSTQLNRWQREGNVIVIETTTTITTASDAHAATPQPSSTPLPSTPAPSRQQRQRSSEQQASSTPEAARSFNLTATITSRQRWENQKIVQQEILSERSQLTSGDKPPTLTVSLPEQVRIGQPFDFDAVVTEPLGERLLLGAAIEEPVQASGYLGTTPVELELLSAGGLFKVGQAPSAPGNRWVSAIIVRDDGITTVTQRMQVTPRSTGAR